MTKIRRFVDLGFVKTCDELVKSDRIWHRCQSQRGRFGYDGTLPLSLLNVSIFQTLEEELQRYKSGNWKPLIIKIIFDVLITNNEIIVYAKLVEVVKLKKFKKVAWIRSHHLRRQ